MDEPKPWHVGDPCPACGGELKPAPVPTEEQRARAEDREIREALPRHYDTASAKQIAELGTLYRCDSCRYAARVPASKGAHGKPSKAA